MQKGPHWPRTVKCSCWQDTYRVLYWSYWWPTTVHRNTFGKYIRFKNKWKQIQHNSLSLTWIPTFFCLDRGEWIVDISPRITESISSMWILWCHRGERVQNADLQVAGDLGSLQMRSQMEAMAMYYVTSLVPNFFSQVKTGYPNLLAQ